MLKVKKKAYSILKRLKRYVDKNDYERYMKLLNDFQKIYRIIDRDKSISIEENREWDDARNKLNLVFILRKSTSGRLGTQYYVEQEKNALKKFSEIMDKLKKYLK